MKVKDKQYLGSVWRVDSELLTLECISCKDLDDDTPLDVWLYAAIGTGYYCYFSDCEDAKKALLIIIDLRIGELNERKISIACIDSNA